MFAPSPIVTNDIRVNIKEAAEFITMCMFSRLVPMMHGNPGI